MKVRSHDVRARQAPGVARSQYGSKREPRAVRHRVLRDHNMAQNVSRGPSGTGRCAITIWLKT